MVRSSHIVYFRKNRLADEEKLMKPFDRTNRKHIVKRKAEAVGRMDGKKEEVLMRLLGCLESRSR